MSHSSTEGSKVPAHAACSLCSYHTGNTFIERRINSNGESTFILLISAYQLHEFFIFKQPPDYPTAPMVLLGSLADSMHEALLTKGGEGEGQ